MATDDKTTKSVRVVSAWEHDRLLREARLSLPTLPHASEGRKQYASLNACVMPFRRPT